MREIPPKIFEKNVLKTTYIKTQEKPSLYLKTYVFYLVHKVTKHKLDLPVFSYEWSLCQCYFVSMTTSSEDY